MALGLAAPVLTLCGNDVLVVVGLGHPTEEVIYDCFVLQ